MNDENPNPQFFRKWHIPNPYDAQECMDCLEVIPKGDLINIEYEEGVMHAFHADAGQGGG